MKREIGLSLTERLEKYRILKGQCWETLMDPNKKYPQMKIAKGKFMVHRISYSVYIGPIPQNLLVLHRCDNTRCHRPSHLFLGTHSDNNKDCVAKGRWVKAKRPATLDINEVLRLHETCSQQEIADRLGVVQSTISVALRKIGLSRGRTTSFRKDHGLGGRRKKRDPK